MLGDGPQRKRKRGRDGPGRNGRPTRFQRSLVRRGKRQADSFHVIILRVLNYRMSAILTHS